MNLTIVDDNLNKKVYIDDLNKIRLANPNLFESSNALKSESEQFIKNLSSYIKHVQNVRKAVEEIGKISDQERLRALNAQNELQKIESGNADENSEENQQLRILVREKQVELERLKVELQSYKSIQTQQQEYLQRLRSSFINK